MPTLGVLRRQAAELLKAKGFDVPELEARWLLEGATQFSASALRAAEGDEAAADVQLLYRNLLERRLVREPLARILGWREFWGLRFHLNRDTLEPRPDSEAIVRAALAQFPQKDVALRVADWGTGTGCLLAALLHERPRALGVGVDRSQGAARQARANLDALGLGPRALVVVGSWGDALGGPFDLLVSNPPYVPQALIPELAPEVAEHDPLLALDGGADGLEAYRALLPAAASLLTPDGRFIVEIGLGQSRDVVALAAKSGLNHLETMEDFGGVARVLVFARAQ